MILPIYIGWDDREAAAYDVAVASIVDNSSAPVQVRPLVASDLYAQRLLWRPVESDNGRRVDHLSGAAQSTDFATSRFLIPFVQRSGWALFADCDIVCMADIRDLFALADERYAVMCVKHEALPSSGHIKMDGQLQQPYPRKNWSSVVLWNCDHIAHTRLSVPQVNHWPGQLLHRFAWLTDEEIGPLPAEWNWLVGVQAKPERPKIAHFTLGGPWLPHWRGAEHDEIWHAAASHRKASA